jgi:2-polyprenyl-3-methyl-5-hydroxy-6-metoxy-1,4-benzoquinol methylase
MFFYGRENFHKCIKPYLPSEKSSRILDIGCGHGTCISELIKAGYTEVEGIDISIDQIDLGKKTFQLDCLHCQDPIEFLNISSRKYDAILLTNVLEHLELDYSIKLINSIKASLAPEGVIIAQVPNAFSPFSPHLYMDITHLRAYSIYSLRQLFNMSGEFTLDFFPVYPNALSKWRNSTTKFIWKCVINPFLIAYFSLALCDRMGSIYTPNLLFIAKNRKHSTPR